MRPRYLLDTCTFLWLSFEPERLSDHAREIVEGESNELLLSSISVLEIAILHSVGKKTGFKNLRVDLPKIREALDLTPLQHTEEDALTLAYLPLAHRDPFDRALIAQAITEGVPVITPDDKFGNYPVQLVW